MALLNNGYLGIGTNNPTAELHVVGPSGFAHEDRPVFRMVRDYITIEDGSSELWFVVTGDNRYWRIHSTKGTFDFEYISDNGNSWTEKIRFDSNGPLLEQGTPQANCML